MLVVHSEGQRVCTVVVANTAISQAVCQCCVDVAQRSGEHHAGVTAPVTGAKGQARGTAERERAIGYAQGDLQGAAGRIDIGNAESG